jgi:hypothetical protein
MNFDRSISIPLSSLLLFGLASSFPVVSRATASIPPEKVRISEAKKTQNYLKDGLFTGGDQAIQNVVIKGIRRAANTGFERIVIDLEGYLAGEPAAIARAPYYQVAVSPEEKRLIVSVWGDPQLQFDAKTVIKNFKKSPWISEVELLPKVEPQFWSFVFHLKAEASVEVFELRDPVRIILDVKKNTTASL